MDESRKIAHLLKRAGFGIDPDEFNLYCRKGFTATLDELLNYEKIPDELDSLSSQILGDLIDLNDAADIKALWLYRMVRTRRPLQEKMTLFWHGHFATANSKVNNGSYMQQQNDLFRRYAVSDFRSLLMGVSKDPAMLVYLDGNQNRRGQPNENYGREIMELFTLGVGNYSEEDVKAAARAFTGWQIREGKFFFNPGQHDDGEKVFLGRTGRFDGTDIVDILSSSGKTANFLCTKLFRFFVSEEPDQRSIDMMAGEYMRTRGEIRSVLRKLFNSDAFYSEKFVEKKIKSPVELMVNAIRALDGKISLRSLARILPRLGQDLFNPPNVKGWDGGLVWINTCTAVERLNLMKVLATGVNNQQSPLLDPKELVSRFGIQNAEQLVDHFLARFGIAVVTAQERQSLVQYVLARPKPDSEPFPGPSTIDAKVRGMAQLVLSLPSFQLN